MRTSELDAARFGPVFHCQMFKKPKYSHGKMHPGGQNPNLSQEGENEDATDGRRKAMSSSDTSTSSSVSSEVEMSAGEADSGTKSSLTDPLNLSLAIPSVPGTSKAEGADGQVLRRESPTSRETAQSMPADQSMRGGKEGEAEEGQAERECSATVTTDQAFKAGVVESSQFSNESDSATTLTTQNVSILEEGTSGRVLDRRVDRARIAQSSVESDSFASTSGREHSMADLDCPPHGLVSVCGRRREMEDAVAAFPSLVHFPPIPALRAVTEEAPLHFFGVYDGHGGSQVSRDQMFFIRPSGMHWSWWRSQAFHIPCLVFTNRNTVILAVFWAVRAVACMHFSGSKQNSTSCVRQTKGVHGRACVYACMQGIIVPP